MPKTGMNCKDYELEFFFFFLGTSDGVLIGIHKAREMAFLTRDSRSFWHGLREVFGTMKESEGKQRLRNIANEQSLV